MVHRFGKFSADPKLPHDQAVKHVLKYLKGADTQGLILKTDPEKGIESYVGSNVASRRNQEKGAYTRFVLSIMG